MPKQKRHKKFRRSRPSTSVWSVRKHSMESKSGRRYPAGVVGYILYKPPIPRFHLMQLRMQTAWMIGNIATPSGYIAWQMNNLFNPMSLALGVAFTSNAAIIHTNGSVDADNPNCFTNYCSATGLYGTYRVLSAAVTVKTMGNPNSGQQALKFAIAPTPTLASVFGSYKSVAQAQYSKTNPNVSMVYKPNSFKHKMSIARAMGVTKRVVLDDDSFYATYGAAPTTAPCWQLEFISTDNANITTNCPVTLELSWIVRFERPNYVGSQD